MKIDTSKIYALNLGNLAINAEVDIWEGRPKSDQFRPNFVEFTNIFTHKTETTPDFKDLGAEYGWIIQPQTNGTFCFRNLFLINHTLIAKDDATLGLALYEPDGSLRQQWHAKQLESGLYQFASAYTDPPMFELVRKTLVAQNDYEKLDNLLDPKGMGLTPLDLTQPALASDTGAKMPLGATDYSKFLKGTGTLKAIMVCVDFPDIKNQREKDGAAAPDVQSAQAACTRAIGNKNQAVEIFKAQSNGLMTLEIDNRSDLGWRELPQQSTHYLPPSASFLMNRFKQDAKAVFSEIKFENYDITIIVLPKDAEVGYNANAFEGDLESEIESKTILAWSNNKDIPYINLVHELGNQLGLPDLYPYHNYRTILPPKWKAADDQTVGCWSIMTNLPYANSFLGWERFKLGWVPIEKIAYLGLAGGNKTHTCVLRPHTNNIGIEMIVVDISPSIALVVELAQSNPGLTRQNGSLQEDGKLNPSSGVLVYSVDSSISTGHYPIKIVPNKISTSPEFGPLFEAPWQDGTSTKFTVPGTNTKYILQVSKLDDTDFYVQLQYDSRGDD